MKETIPSIRMERGAKYVTQSAMWDVPRLGPLTDRAIERYQRQGRYGPYVEPAKKPKTTPSPRRQLERASKARLLALLKA
jgi:topoisomerase IA-like protein